MGNEADNKFTWVIKNFSALQSKLISSDPFVIDNCRWRLLAYPKGYNKPGHFSLFLDVANLKPLPPGWKRKARYHLTIVNQISENRSQINESIKRFNEKTPCWGLLSMLRLTKLHAKDGGFLVNDELKILAEVDVLQVIGKFDVPEEFEESTQPMKMRKLDVQHGVESNHLLKGDSSAKETINVNGFEVLPSQVVLVRRIFGKYPDIALELCAKNPHLKTAYMNFLLYLIETVCKPLQELSKDDLVEACIALTHVKDAGFKVDWLEQKLEELKEKKMEEQTRETRIQELKNELKDFKQKCSDIEALLEKEKAKVFAAKAPLMLDDVI